MHDPLSKTARAWLEQEIPAVLVSVAQARGSVPRDAGASMLVAADAIAGTIGGGQLEWIAMEHARAMLDGKTAEPRLDIPLGPEIGQCCGGHVSLDFAVLDAGRVDALERGAGEPPPRVLIFGAGHTGKALARALALAPVEPVLIDTRDEALAGLGEIETRHVALPEAEVAGAPPATAFVVMTHEHSLDFLITGAALARSDAAYVGMIGSATKRAVFASWLRDSDYADDLIDRLVCPIGGTAVRDKRPEIIAALTAAEVLTALHRHATQSTASEAI